jgi:hypothetical protein
MQGIVLTDCMSIGGLLSAVRANHIPLLKVVTGWGAAWDDASRAEVCTTMPEVLVRTISGDGTRGPPALAPDAVVAELRPWYDVGGNVTFEIGNEPNGYDSSDDAAWNFRYWFLESLNVVRESFPAARIVAPGLIEHRQSEWWAICQDAFELADAIGFHAYAYHDADDTGQLGRALSDLALFFPYKTWMLTEYGINDMATSAETKATRYAALHAKLPSQVAAACWYHFCERPIDDDQESYALPPAALPYLYAGGTL